MQVDSDVKFLTQFYALAKRVEHEYGIPAFATLAQHIWEGGRDNPHPTFNYFGIKPGPKWKGATKRQVTWEWHKTNDKAKAYGADFISMSALQGGYRYKVYQVFRAYSSAEEAYLDRGRFLRIENPRYAKAGCFEPGISAEEFCRRLAKAGYATDNEYATKLVSVIAQLKKKLALVPLLPAAPLATAPSVAAPPKPGAAS